MPQMAPINWLILFLFFISMYLILMNIMYFSFLKSIKKKLINMNKMMKNYNKFI